jgi:hypothetical protein
VVAGVGFVVQRWALSPLVRHGDESALLTTFGKIRCRRGPGRPGCAGSMP